MEDNKTNNIISVINALRSDDFYGAGKYTEIAKGKYQIVSNWSDAKSKIKRLIKSKK